MDAARNGDAAALRDFVERRVQLAGGAISSAKRHTAGMFPSVSLARGGEPASGGWAECLYWMLSAVERDCGLHATEVWVRLSWSGDLPWTALHALMTMGSDCAPGADVKPWLSMVIALLAYGAEPRVRWVRTRAAAQRLHARRTHAQARPARSETGVPCRSSPTAVGPTRTPETRKWLSC